jgi:uncharacterized protein (DUF983 family)
MVSPTEINRMKTLIQPTYAPIFVICMCGCGIGGFELAQSYWHWPVWLFVIIGAPVSCIMGLILTMLLTIVIALYKDRKYIPSKSDSDKIGR